MDPSRLGAIALVLGAIGVLMLAALAIMQAVLARRTGRTLADALDQRAAALEAAAARVAAGAGAAGVARAGMPEAAPDARRPRFAALLDRAGRFGMRLLDTRLGKQIVADEDRMLLEQCGYVDAHTRGIFLSARIACAIALPAAVALVGGETVRTHLGAWVALSVIAGFMLPKTYVRRRAAARRQSVVDEMPLLVDMLRLLQGVGLSLDQSIQVVTNDFRGMLPVLSSELGIAQRQFVAGRTREQSLQRLAMSFDNEDLRAIVRLLIQVDKHGGAVQEPLKQFGDRLREVRRAMLRERIGRLTVKMTGVMILTLLPALFIVTAGPGMLAVTHALTAARR
ncbi:type II secretion system F family protein [Burkholderia pseudomallei]|uniref:type II secretion system F family protein n=1 Tax=Burkholderia pseudomallei TaxID=28450 RepID=UPI001AAE2E74|nr:type II secretion system F family protein [Burkholderia pseudomallei]MBO2960631.1 type II secretion system F family protein [Burkholderia pseudomallei]MBO7835119.1 type II secretion system F family protein [Burkholderia pseudomallei]MBO7853232.1 type II secretion system F family protein [Burkholderia pseudomallei]